MSIVAERPVRVQVGDRPKGQRSRAERDRVRPAVTAGTPERAVVSGYTTGERVRVNAAVDAPLTPEQRERLGRLFARYHTRLVGYLVARLGPDRRDLALDLAQDVWVEVARPRAQQIVAQRADDDLFGLLAGYAKWAVGQHFARMSARCEQLVTPADQDDSVERALERLAQHSTVVPAAPQAAEETELGGRFAEALERMPKDLRIYAHLRFELGMSTRAIEDLTGWAAATVWRRGQRVATLLRRVADGEEVAVAPAPSALPEGWERVVDRLPDHYRAVVRLRAEGLSTSAIAARIGYSKGGAGKVVARAVRELRAALRDIGAHVEQTAGARATAVPDGWEQVVGELPEDLRAIVLLREQGLTYRQIGERLGCGPAYAGERFRRACARMEGMLRDAARQAAA